VPPDAGSDRYDPLPGIAEIPAFLYGKLSTRGRRLAAVVGAALVVVVAVALVIAIPKINESKQDRAAADRRIAREGEAALVKQLKAEQRLREGTGTPAPGRAGAAVIAARRALAADLSAAVLTDARARVRTGEFAHPVLRVECERYPRGAHGEDPATDLKSPMGRYSCLAVTADTPRTATESASSLGYPYRALVDYPKGRFTYCKFSGRPGEGMLHDSPVRVPAACGGATPGG
jgi:hypothetical protein